MTKQKKITEKQKEFCRNYIKTGNGTVSYRKAYGCESRAASSNASVLLRKTNIQDYIQELREEQEAEIILQTEQLREQIIDSIKGNLLLSKLMRNICISQIRKGRKGSDYDLPESWVKTISVAGKTASQLDKEAREGFMSLYGLDKIAEQMADNDD